MENATKALLIAGGVLIGLMVVSACLIAYNQITDYYQENANIARTEQVLKFNNEYTVYDRNDVRGSELLSLINKVVDYNKREADVSGIEFERMVLSIDVGEAANYLYNTTDTSVENEIILENLENDKSNSEYSGLKSLSQSISRIKESSGYTEEQLRRLATNISTIFLPDEYITSQKQKGRREEEIKKDNTYIKSTTKRNTVVKGIIGNDYDSVSDQNKLKVATLQYYQIQQFKRAHFDCIGREYNKNTGRIVKMEFKFNGTIE